ncbi:secreted RxLR effector protein 161-like [Brassica napus]|uniref:secreted RxLR effector protein 161-like n=1 Tax=Brassica napus TaxID=3708 RepID=UPI002078E1EF|nr:secreted RxLR effector protein 161-like [Brassica napus]
MVVRSLDVNKDPFRPREKNEEVLGPEVPYLSAIGALMYLASHTRPDISFAVNLLARFSSCPTRRHWNGIKHILRYLQDDGYMSDPHNARSQTGYVFTCGGTAISWRSMKQTIAATSSNHAEILAIHEASRECVWLRSVIQHIREDCGLSTGKESPTDGYMLHKNGDVRVVQVRSSDNLADLFTKALPTSTFKKVVHLIGLRRLKDLDVCIHEGK